MKLPIRHRCGGNARDCASSCGGNCTWQSAFYAVFQYHRRGGGRSVSITEDHATDSAMMEKPLNCFSARRRAECAQGIDLPGNLAYRGARKEKKSHVARQNGSIASSANVSVRGEFIISWRLLQAMTIPLIYIFPLNIPLSLSLSVCLTVSVSLRKRPPAYLIIPRSAPRRWPADST